MYKYAQLSRLDNSDLCNTRSPYDADELWAKETLR